MKKLKLKLFLILFVIVTLISTAVFATDTTAEPATTGQDTNTTTEGGDEATPDIDQFDRVFTGEDIVIDTLIAGNVVAIGKNVTVSGGIGGNLYVIAETLNMEHGVVYGSMYVMASQVTMGGDEDENGGKAYEVYAVCDKLTLGYYGGVQTDLKVMAKEVDINGVIFRNIYADADKVKINSDAEIQGDLIYTSQSEAIYMQREEPTEVVEEGMPTPEPVVKETTEIPSNNVYGERKFTKRDNKLYSKDNEIQKAVEKIIKETKDMDEEKIKTAIVSNIFNGLGVKTNNELTKGKDKSNTMQIPSIYVYIDIIVIIALVVALILPRIKKSKKEVAEVKTEGTKK